MGLTKIGTDGVKDDAITSGKIPANAVGNSEIADDAIRTRHYNNNSIDTAFIADQAVTLDKLPHGTPSNDGKFLRANNGADPTFETVNTDLVSDTSPQLGGALASNGHNILFADGDTAKFGTGNDLNIYHNGSNSYVTHDNGSGHLYLQGDAIRLRTRSATGNEDYIVCSEGGAVQLYHHNSKRLETTSGGVDISGTTDGVVNLNTTDARGSFVRFQLNGTSKVYAGCGEGMGLGSEDDFGIRTGSHLRVRTGTEEHMVVTNEGFVAGKGMAGNWVDGNHPTSSQHHQFSNTGTNKWIMVMNQQHHAGLGLAITGNSTGNAEALWLYSNSNNSVRFRVLWNGNVASATNSYGSTSDVKLKENIVDAKSQWDDIKGVKVRNFNFKADTDKTKMLGVVAQELETVSPKLIWEDKEGVKGVHYSVLYMKAIKALQEAMAKIEVLETKVTALEAA
mgnify:CR=1 FL=1|jgi:hypothetical protein|tara:strand:+ start:1174 stop:2526 length:1353 start_codon:yes stop_codon:yes gene_type:complete